MERQKFETKMASFPRSKVWDKTTQGRIDAIRAFIHRHPQPTISHLQSQSIQERPLKGLFHLVPDTLPAPVEDDIREALFRTIDSLGKLQYEQPSLAPVPVEWVSKSRGYDIQPARSRTIRSDISEPNEACTTDLVILHVHGGAFLYV